MDVDELGGAVRVARVPVPASPRDRGIRRPVLGRLLRPLVGILATAALIWPMSWTEPADVAPLTAAAPGLAAPVPAAIPAASPQAPVLSATGTLQLFVLAANLGSLDATLGLMTSELPDVPGLGSVNYPRFAGDPGLWVDGIVDGDNVAGFVDRTSSQRTLLSVSDCKSFADGPKVTVAACAYTALPSDGSRETGRLYGFVVDGKIAGLVHRTDLPPA